MSKWRCVCESMEFCEPTGDIKKHYIEASNFPNLLRLIAEDLERRAPSWEFRGDVRENLWGGMSLTLRHVDRKTLTYEMNSFPVEV